MVVEAPALAAELRLVSVFAHIPPPPPTTHINISQLPVVLSEHMRTFFDSTQSQESKSEVMIHIETISKTTSNFIDLPSMSKY